MWSRCHHILSRVDLDIIADCNIVIGYTNIETHMYKIADFKTLAIGISKRMHVLKILVNKV